MPKTDSKRKADAKWDAANMSVISLKARRDKAEAFKAACAEAGTNMNSVLTAAMDDFLREHGIDPDSFSRRNP